ncbi:Phosphoglycolate phosphatase [hydrothermal vent metagenome]|uniref:phosphoglycolate phosphatase n=1 Tax=hydrothermal vent metagenome TaxID=652676 RepID=A0A3B0R4C3_9ZZZZ
MSSYPSAIIFDLDGTLVDSAPDLCGALNHVLRQAGRPEMDIARVRHMVGDGARALIIKGFSTSGDLPDANGINAILQDFLDFYLDNITAQTVIFPGALNVLKKLAEMNIPLGLCTNKAIKLTTKLMAESGLSGYFSAIIGGDSFDYCKPDPRHLTSTLNDMKASPDGAVMVGDSINDILAAKAAGIPVICASFGYSKTPIATLNPDAIFDHYDTFFDALHDISSAF